MTIDRSAAARKAAATRKANRTSTSVEGIYSMTSSRDASPLTFSAPIISMRIVRDGSLPAPLQITSPADLAAMLVERYASADREIMVVVAADTHNRIIAVDPIAVGGLDYAMISMREVFKSAIMLGAACIFLAHNHPSGEVTPSPEDITLTRRIIDAGRLLEVQVMDHIVLGSAGKWTSMREMGVAFA